MGDVKRDPNVPPVSRAMGLLRVGLGLAQVMAATVALCFLLTIGMTNLTLGATAVTLFLTVLSRLLFAKSDRKH